MKLFNSLKAIIYLVLIAPIMTSWGSNTAKAPLSAHVHGVVGLDIAVDKKEILIMFKSPSESVLGFEHYPKTGKQKKLVADAKKLWLNDFSRLFFLDSSLGCKFKEKKWEHFFESKSASHSEVRAQAYLECKTSLNGRQLSINLKKVYPRIEKIHLQLIDSSGKATSSHKKESVIKIKL